MKSARIGAIGALVALAGCATPHPTLSVTKYGVADPEGEQRIVRDYEAATGGEVEVSADEVVVLVETVPEGIEVDSGMLSVAEGFDHEIVARFQMRLSVAMPLWFGDYRAGWRKGLCYPQVPLTWVTLGIWMVVPTSWPCGGNSVADQAVFVQDVRRLARAAGGDTAVVSFLKGSGNEAAGAKGVILRLDPNVDRDDFERKPWRPAGGKAPETFD